MGSYHTTISASIVFKPNEEPVKFSLIPSGDAKPWRFLAEDCAIEFFPVCDSEARPVIRPPSFDQVDAWPVQWGYPDLLGTKYPELIDQLQKEYSEAKANNLPSYNLSWEDFFRENGIPELWRRGRTPEMERYWLNWRTGPGGTLNAYAGLAGRVSREACESIRLCAEFRNGNSSRTIFFSCCYKIPLTDEERRNSSAFIVEQKALVEKLEGMKGAFAHCENVAAKLAAAADSVKKATELGDLYNNPTMADAKTAAIKHGVPKEFVAYCHTEMHVSKFPSSTAAARALQTSSMLRSLNTGNDMRTTAWRWLTIVRTELEKRGLLEPRGIGQSVKKAQTYNLEQYPASPAATDDAHDSSKSDESTKIHGDHDPQGYE
jgi:hypothetical protein